MSKDLSDKEKDNVINLAEKRKRQATLYGASRHGPKRAKQKKGTEGPSNIRWVHYVQFFAFLAILAMMMQYCGGGL